MRSTLADISRALFRIPFFRKRFYGIYERIISPWHLFRGVRKSIYFQDRYWFDLSVDDWIQAHLFFLGEYEQAELDFLSGFLQKGDVLIDIGANIGLYSLWVARLVGPQGKVIAFEPVSSNFEQLKHNISLNAPQPIVLEKMAVTDKSGPLTIRYHQGDANRGMASAYLPEFTHSEEVQATTLDEYLAKNPVSRLDFIKMDIEGGEYPALLGMQETLARYTPAILVEIKPSVLSQTGYTTEAIVALLAELGYIRNAGLEAGDNWLFMKNV